VKKVTHDVALGAFLIAHVEDERSVAALIASAILK